VFYHVTKGEHRICGGRKETDGDRSVPGGLVIEVLFQVKIK